MSFEFQVRQEDLAAFRIVKRPEEPLKAGQIRVKIDVFAFTANNITYGVAGHSLGYWQFFPATANADGEWGIIPVWGFADVVDSVCESIPVGERLYGYFPPAGTAILEPTNVNERTLFDGIEHRAKLPPLYNRYTRMTADPAYDRQTDAARILLAPLHLTSFCLCHQLQENDGYGAEQVVIISASSKTSLGVAYGLPTDKGAAKVVGLTSNRNVQFVTETGLYDQIISYDTITDQLENRPTVIIDMAGNANVKSTLETMLGDNLAHYISVGVTHWDELHAPGGFDNSAPAPRHENFFAPGYILQKLQEWGPAGFDQRSSAFVMGAAKATFAWIKPNVNNGLAGLADIYPDICGGTAPASVGQIIKM